VDAIGRHLRGFERVGMLQPGESREVQFAWDRDCGAVSSEQGAVSGWG
jgi:hypothetical protein